MTERPANTSRVESGTARIDQHRRKLRQFDRRREPLADAAHDARPRIETDRHIGADRQGGCREARIAGRQIVRARQQPQRRGSVGGAAAEAAGDRNILLQAKVSRP